MDSKNELTSKDDIMMIKLRDFYKKKKNIDEFLNVVTNKESNISLRILDWFTTNYSKNKIQSYTLNGKEYFVYQEYKAQLKKFKKKSFDPFCRRERIEFQYDNNPDNKILTTVGQLNFFKWIIENNILDYIQANLPDIEKDMCLSLKRSKEEKKKTGNNSRKKRQELSVSAHKTVNIHDIEITISFN
tara:strand:+ start:1438 stop:1998 length:561 start_codon:yes stop_codon:yes gene_type:complete